MQRPRQRHNRRDHLRRRRLQHHRTGQCRRGRGRELSITSLAEVQRQNFTSTNKPAFIDQKGRRACRYVRNEQPRRPRSKSRPNRVRYEDRDLASIRLSAGDRQARGEAVGQPQQQINNVTKLVHILAAFFRQFHITFELAGITWQAHQMPNCLNRSAGLEA